MLRAFAALGGFLLFSTAAMAQPAGGSSGPAFNLPIPNIPGKSLTAVVVNYPPGAGTPPHHHAPSAFITGYVLEGTIRSQVDGGPVKVYRKGEYFTENPGAHHQVSENASKTEPAQLLAIFVVNTNEAPLTTLDKK